MCRILYARVHDRGAAVSSGGLLSAFSELCRISPEYQGHGWGIAYRSSDGTTGTFHAVEPIWESRSKFESRELVEVSIHARSAFRDEGIVVENNMPFSHDGTHFIFNGELQGVSIREEGRIGAEKIFHFIRRFASDGQPTSIERALHRAIPIILRRTRYVRALNLILTQLTGQAWLSTHFNERPEYFGMVKGGSPTITVAASFPIEIPQHSIHWQPIPSGTTIEL